MIWGDFLGEMRMAKVDILGRGDSYLIDDETVGRETHTHNWK